MLTSVCGLLSLGGTFMSFRHAEGSLLQMRYGVRASGQDQIGRCQDSNEES